MNNPKKVILVSPYYPPHIGGVEFYVKNVAEGFKKYFNWEVVIITTNLKSKKKIVERDNGIKIYRLPILFKVSNTPINPLWYFQIRKIIKRERPDIINAHIPVPFMTDIVSLVKGKVPLVITYHALTLKKGNKSFTNPINILASVYEQIGRNTLKRATALIVVVSLIKNGFPKVLQNRTWVINNSIWKNEINKNIRVKNNKDIVFISSLEKTHSWKGLDQVIESIKYYVDNFDKEINLYVIGDGTGKNSYIKKVEGIGLSNNIHFVGAKFGDEKNKLIRESSLLVAYPTTSNDAFPSVFLEAWAAGVPVISSNITPINSIIKHEENGYLVDPNSPNKLGKAIKKIFDNPALQEKIIFNSLQKIKAENLWDDNILRIHDIFTKVIN